MKKYKLVKTEHTISLPEEVLFKLAEMDADEFRALILIAASESGEADIQLASMSEDDFDAAASFLRGAGLVALQKGKKKASGEGEKTADAEVQKPSKPSANKARKVSVARREYNPEYTSAEISALMRENELLSSLMDACQQTLGKVFNASESNIIITLHNFLGLDGEYILMLLAECAEKDKKNLTYILRMATALVEQGITTPVQLEEEFARREALSSSDGALRKMFGIGTRELTKKENELFTLWVCDRKHSIELIKTAFDLTVQKTGKASVPYCNTILEDWFANGIKTPEAAKDAASGKKTADKVRGSFETDDFFGDALNRSLAGFGEK